jgi:hypothetical protein
MGAEKKRDPRKDKLLFFWLALNGLCAMQLADGAETNRGGTASGSPDF